ncbi:MAG: GNAT family N-acetyltransferase [Albidovulum sp.]|uniref:GNAT family N-acetyltransferase n=1 Tax=Albidovulum sp. TaxID=1872424 RepID=UPI003C927CB0
MPIRAVIKTARLTLRPPMPDDASAFAAALADWEVARWLSAPPWPYGLDDARDFLTGVATANHWVIECQGEVAGLIGIKPDLGYWLNRHAWGKGFASEAACAVLAAHFADPAADIVRSGHFDGNTRSRHVLGKRGFRPDGFRITRCRATGDTSVLLHSMALTRAEWLAANPLLIETERLVLRPLDPEKDAGPLARIGGDESVAPMLMSVPRPWPEADARDWILRAPWRGYPGFRLGIFLKGGPLIGATGLGPSAPMTTMYFIDPAHWDQGYATEAMQGFLDWTTRHFAPEAIEADHFTDNPASARVLSKLGFTETGTGLGTSAARPGPAPVRIWRRTF